MRYRKSTFMINTVVSFQTLERIGKCKNAGVASAFMTNSVWRTNYAFIAQYGDSLLQKNQMTLELQKKH